MSGDQVQFRGGSATECNAFTPAARELVVDTTNWNLRLGDGGTQGGRQILTNQSLIQQAPLWCGTAGGTANALTLAPSPAPAFLITGMTWRCLVGSTNTGAATLAINGGTAYAIKDLVGNDLLPGFLTAGQVAEFTWTGSNYRTTRDAPSLLQRLSSVAPSGTPTWIEFALPATIYDVFQFDVHAIVPTVAAAFVAQLSVDNGATWISSAGNYTCGGYGSITPGFFSATTQAAMFLSYSQAITIAAGLRGTISLDMPAAATGYTRYEARTSGLFSSPAWEGVTYQGATTATSARPNRIRFGWVSTTWVNQGRIIMSGMTS